MESSAIFNNLTGAEKDAAIEGIIQHSTPRQDFFLMLILSVSMAAFGILLQSAVILIGSMLIAPILYPLLSLSLGIVVVDENLIRRSLFTIFKSVAYALIAGFLVGFLFSTHETILFPFDIAGAPSSMMYAIVAVIAGFAAAFATTKPRLTETLPGVAISVALVPPLAAAGVALSSFSWLIFREAMLLFSVNVIGIVFSVIIVFTLFRFSRKKTVADEVLKEEDKIVKKEEGPK